MTTPRKTSWYRHSPTYAIVTLRRVRHRTKSEVSIHIWYGELHVCWLYKRVKVEIQDPARCYLTGRSMTALQPVLSLICCHYRLTALSLPLARIPYTFQNTLLFHYFYLFKIARV
jgi:hypothetical protein